MDEIIGFDLGNNKRVVFCSRKPNIIGQTNTMVYKVGILWGCEFIAEFYYGQSYDDALQLYKKKVIETKELFELSNQVSNKSN